MSLTSGTTARSAAAGVHEHHRSYRSRNGIHVGGGIAGPSDGISHASECRILSPAGSPVIGRPPGPRSSRRQVVRRGRRHQIRPIFLHYPSRSTCRRYRRADDAGSLNSRSSDTRAELLHGGFGPFSFSTLSDPAAMATPPGCRSMRVSIYRIVKKMLTFARHRTTMTKFAGIRSVFAVGLESSTAELLEKRRS